MSRENNDSKICSARTTYYIYINKLILSLAYTKINPQTTKKKNSVAYGK